MIALLFYLISFLSGVPPTINPPTNPNITQPPVTMNISVGENVCLPFDQSVDIDCVAMGTHPITYTWTRQPNSAVIGTNSTLTVTQTGIYTCTATNAFGSDNASSTVFGMPFVFHLANQSTITILLTTLKSMRFRSKLIYE